uniref:Uncharacterized protein n=1 Tax=Anopheles christyi TaxID=43041 RepID=A0A182K913_9DIPT
MVPGVRITFFAPSTTAASIRSLCRNSSMRSSSDVSSSCCCLAAFADSPPFSSDTLLLSLFWRTFSILSRRYSIFAFESASIWCASASSFLSRPWCPLEIDWIMFSAPFFTFVSMLSCFSSDMSSLSLAVNSGPLGITVDRI